MIQAAHKAAFAAQLRLNGEDVTVTRPEGIGVQLRALRGQTNFREQNNQTGSVRIVRSTDFIFDPDAFRQAIGGWPEDGTLIKACPPLSIAGLTSQTFRATPINGEPVYRLDATYTRLRIHTQEYCEATSLIQA